MEALADHFAGVRRHLAGRARARARAPAPASLERALTLGVGSVVPWLIFDVAFAELALGRPERARDRLEAAARARRGAHRLRHGVGAVPARRNRTTARLTAAPRPRRSGRDHRRTARQSLPRDSRRASPKAAWPPRAATGRSLNSTRSRTSTPAPRAATRPTCPACLDALAEIAAGLKRHVDAARLLRRRRARPGRDRHRPRPPRGRALGGDRPPATRRAADRPTRRHAPRAPN